MAGKYVITGRVHPERADISFGRIELKLNGDQSAVASCDSSQITVTLNMPKLDGWIAAMIVAEDIATIMVGALGFSLGSGYWVELIQVTEEDGTPHVFGVRPTDPTSGGTLGVEPQIAIFNRAFRLSGQNLFFRLAISRLPSGHYGRNRLRHVLLSSNRKHQVRIRVQERRR